jgi:hypothetical protein
MGSFVDALRAVASLKQEGVVEEYALAGAMAIIFWTDPVPTYDLDVLVFLPEAPGMLLSLDSIYAWAKRNKFPASEEHLLIHGVPTQFLPSPSPLADEAVRSATELDYEGVLVRVTRPEYLIALYLEPAARSPRRRERAALLMELAGLNQHLLRDIMNRYDFEF